LADDHVSVRPSEGVGAADDRDVSLTRRDGNGADES
jgi:hypothetical protein